LKQTYPK